MNPILGSWTFLEPTHDVPAVVNAPRNALIEKGGVTRMELELEDVLTSRMAQMNASMWTYDVEKTSMVVISMLKGSASCLPVQ